VEIWKGGAEGILVFTGLFLSSSSLPSYDYPVLLRANDSYPES